MPDTKPAASVTTSNERQLLYDGRLAVQPEGGARLYSIAQGRPAPAELDAASLTTLEAELFPKRLSAPGECKGGEEGTVANGQFIPTLRGFSSEAPFTAASARQTLYLYELAFCNGMADSDAGYLVIAEKGSIVLKTKTDYFLAERLIDLSSDGMLDVLMVGGSVGQGFFTSYGEILSFAGGASTQLKKFDSLSEDNCGSDAPPLISTVSVWYHQRDASGKISYSEEQYTAPCGSKDYTQKK